MAWRRPGDKPLSEPMMIYRRIYASLGLNDLMAIELRHVPFVRQRLETSVTPYRGMLSLRLIQ